jgi:hypothetical protein
LGVSSADTRSSTAPTRWLKWADGRPHYHHHGGRVMPMFATGLLELIQSSLDPVKPPIDRGPKRRDILADRDQNVCRYVGRFIRHDKT